MALNGKEGGLGGGFGFALSNSAILFRKKDNRTKCAK